MSIISVTSAAPAKLLVPDDIASSIAGDIEGITPARVNEASAAISAAFVQAVGREFAKEHVTETFVEHGIPRRLWLSRVPLLTVHSLSIDGVAQTEDTHFWIESTEAGQIYLPVLQDPIITGIDYQVAEYPITRTAPRKIVVDYEGGYVLPDWTDQTQTLPNDIVSAVAEAMREMLLLRARDPQMVQRRIGDYMEMFSMSGTSRPGEGSSSNPAFARLMAVAQNYKRPVV